MTNTYWTVKNIYNVAEAANSEPNAVTWVLFGVMMVLVVAMVGVVAYTIIKER